MHDFLKKVADLRKGKREVDLRIEKEIKFVSEKQIDLEAERRKVLRARPERQRRPHSFLKEEAGAAVEASQFLKRGGRSGSGGLATEKKIAGSLRKWLEKVKEYGERFVFKKNEINDVKRSFIKKEKELKIDALRPWRRRRFEIFRIGITGGLIVFCLLIISAWAKGEQIVKQFSEKAKIGVSSVLAGKEMIKSFEFESAAKNFQSAREVMKFFEEKVGNDIEFVNQFGFKSSLLGDLIEMKKIYDEILEIGDAVVLISKLVNEYLFLVNEEMNLLSNKWERIKNESLERYKPTDKLREIEKQVEVIEISLEKIFAIKNSVNLLGFEFREKLKEAMVELQKIKNVLVKAKEFVGFLRYLNGDSIPVRIVFVLQNDAEIRPTGGFIGSLLFLGMNNGRISEFKFKDVYEVDGQIKEFIEPTKELFSVTEKFGVRDANIQPEMKDSGEIIANMIQKGGENSVDIVVAVNFSVAEALVETVLNDSEKIEIGNAKIDKNNLWIILSYLIESKKSTGKEIVRDLITEVFKKAMKTEELKNKLIKLLAKKLQNGEIQVMSRNPVWQEYLMKNGFGGIKIGKEEVFGKAQIKDFLQITLTSVSGNKSDRFIRQKVQQKSLLKKNGEVEQIIEIEREHFFNDEIEKKIRNELSKIGIKTVDDWVMNILGKGENQVWVRVYVPEETKIVSFFSSNGGNVKVVEEKEKGRSYFNFPMKVKIGESQKVIIRSVLPKADFDQVLVYRFRFWPTLGLKKQEFEKKLEVENGLEVKEVWEMDEGMGRVWGWLIGNKF